MAHGPEEILLAEPRGFCAGVDRAIEIVERAIEKFGRPIYVRHEIVHNTFVVNDLKAKGKAIEVAYLFDTARGIKLFAAQAFYVVGDKGAVAPFLLKGDAEAEAKRTGGKVMPFEDALKTVVTGG